MASINISEADFLAVANAAWEAKDRGDEEAAQTLDKIARKINAALSRDTAAASLVGLLGGCRTPYRWQDVPSVFETKLPE